MNRVGTVYGQGLYSLAKEEHLEDTILQELGVLEQCFGQQPEFLKLLLAGNLPKQERVDVLDNSFRGKVHPYVLNFLKLLTEKGYIRQFSASYRAFREQYNTDKGILEVRAISAITLTDSQMLRLSEKLEKVTGKKVALICRVDPAVLGGIRLQYDGKQVDGTVQGRLEAMGRQLKNTVL